MVDDQPDFPDDGDRAGLRELLLDSVPGLSDAQRDAMFEHTFEAPADDEHATDDLIPDDDVFDGIDDWDDQAAAFDEPVASVAEHAVAEHPGAEHVDPTDPTDPAVDIAERADELPESHDTSDESESDVSDFAVDHGVAEHHHVGDSLPDGHDHW